MYYVHVCTMYLYSYRYRHTDIHVYIYTVTHTQFCAVLYLGLNAVERNCGVDVHRLRYSIKTTSALALEVGSRTLCVQHEDSDSSVNILSATTSGGSSEGGQKRRIH